MGWTGWTITGAAIAMGVLVAVGLTIALVRGIRLKRRVGTTAGRITPLAAGIGRGTGDIRTGLSRAEEGAGELAREIERLRVPVAELQVIGRHALVAVAGIKGPLGWVAGIRALVRHRGR